MMPRRDNHRSRLLLAAAGWAMSISAAALAGPADMQAVNREVQPVIEEVDRICREKTVYMIGPKKAERLAELVRQKKPLIVVECGTAIGYSGLWIARELKAAGQGKLITIEINEHRESASP